MEHITDEVVGKHVEGPNGEDIGKITAVEDGRAVLKARTGVSAEIESAISGDADDRLSLSPDQIESIGDDVVRLRSDY